MKRIRAVLPALSKEFHKGQMGKIGVIGGSFEYTGAPYFAAISALKAGADLVHVFCPPDAAAVIKGYSPELIVHPVLRPLSPSTSTLGPEWSWLGRMDGVVLGPGLGQREELLPLFCAILNVLLEARKPVVLDADGLHFLGLALGAGSVGSGGRGGLILTPNHNELRKLSLPFHLDGTPREKTVALAQRLDDVGEGLMIVAKGEPDVIVQSVPKECGKPKVVEIYDEGSLRRCGGQGDLLSGALAAFAFFASKKSLPTSAAGEAACGLTRECARRAFAHCGRSTTTSDLIAHIAPVLMEADSGL